MVPAGLAAAAGLQHRCLACACSASQSMAPPLHGVRRTVAGIQPSCSCCCGVACSCSGGCVRHVRHCWYEGGRQAVLLLLGEVVRVATAQTPYAAPPAGKGVLASWLS